MKEKTIGALSTFTGVSIHTIKYYEKIGLISSNRDEHSNYRSYNVRVCTDIYECLKYRNMDFSLKDTGILLKEADDHIFEQMMEQRSRELSRQIEELKQKKAVVDAYRKEIMNVDAHLGKWYIEELPHFYMRSQTVNLEYGEDAQMETGGVNLIDYVPQSKSVVCLSRDYLNDGEQAFSWGNGIFAEKEKEEFQTEGMTHIKNGRAFVTYMRLTGSYVSNGEMAVAIRKIFRQYKYVFPSDAYGVRIKITHDEEQRDWNYFKIFIPLE